MPYRKAKVPIRARDLARGALFRAAPLLALLAALAGLELGLRAAGYGHNGRLFRVEPIAGAPHLVLDRGFFRAFFPPNLMPHIEPVSAPLSRDPAAYRVAVLGESAALGTPDPAFGFSRVLERMLSARHPATRFEVVNLSATAVNSHVLADMARHLADLRPDVVVVYAGNNEVVGPYGPGSVFAPFLADIRLVRLGIRLARTRTGQLLRDAWRRIAWSARPPERWAGLRMFAERAIPADAPCLSPVYRHFGRNLEDLVAASRGAGARVVLATVGANLRDFAPLASPGEADRVKAAVRYARGQALLARVDAAAESRAAGPRHDSALLDSARRELEAARDLDGLRFRVDARLNAVIRDLAARERGRGVRLADAEAAFAAASPHGLPGRELFHEHVHLTFAGNHLLASAVLGPVEEFLAEARPGSRPVAALPDAEACRRSLGLTGWHRLGMAERIRDLLLQPPFRGRPLAEPEPARAEAEVAAWRAYGEAGKAPEVLDELRAAVGARPDDPTLRLAAAGYLQALGARGEAAGELRAVLEARPHDARARQTLARILAGEGRLGEAAAEYRRALAHDPHLPELRNGLANLLSLQGDLPGAVVEYREALRLHPSLPEVHFNLGRAYARLERPREADRSYRRALALDPGFAPAAEALGSP